MSTLITGVPIWQSATVRTRQHRIAAAVLLSVFLAVAYAPVLLFTAHNLVASEDMAQGLIAPIVAGYIAWTSRRTLASYPANGGMVGLILLSAGTAIQLWSVFAASMTLSRSAFLISLSGCVVLLFGLRGLRTLLFPECMLLFTFPISPVLYGEMTAPLQSVASRLSTLVFDVLGITAVREGNIIQLPAHTLSIIEACSGLRSLLTLLFFTVTYVYFFERRRTVRLFVISLSIPAAILLNVVRITTTGILAEKVSPELTYGFPHEVLGWSCFFAGIAIVVSIHLKLIRRHARPRLQSATN